MKFNKKTKTLEPENKEEEKVLKKVQEANDELLKEEMAKEELKTLKDIKFSSHIEEDLRQEAIKWIKRLSKEEKTKEFGIEKSFINGKINWIKHFFNIIDKEPTLTETGAKDET